MKQAIYDLFRAQRRFAHELLVDVACVRFTISARIILAALRQSH